MKSDIKKNCLIVGNKPYKNLSMDRIIDAFDVNYRCNMSMPGNNNGTKYCFLGLCNHLYDKLKIKTCKEEDFVLAYKKSYREENMRSFFSSYTKNKSKFELVYYAQPKANLYNAFLDKIGCPHRFSKQPRTGYVLMMDRIIKGNSAFITNFTINLKEKRETGYVFPASWESDCHCAEDEVNILRWLHKNHFTDATLCFLLDEEKPNLLCGELEPSRIILDLLKKQYGSCSYTIDVVLEGK